MSNQPNFPQMFDARIGWHTSKQEWVRVSGDNEADCTNIQTLPVITIQEHTAALAEARAEAFDEAAKMALEVPKFHGPAGIPQRTHDELLKLAKACCAHEFGHYENQSTEQCWKCGTTQEAARVPEEGKR